MPKLSTRYLAPLPSPTTLKSLCQSMAAVEAILSPDWTSRYYSYNKAWSETEACFEMHNGQGDEMLILFSEAGVIINGFDHESPMSRWHDESPPIEKGVLGFLKSLVNGHQKVSVQDIWPGVLDQVPPAFHAFVFGEPVKSIGTTFCIWHVAGDNAWRTGTVQFPDGDDADGSGDLLELLTGDPAAYHAWATDYYERYEEAALDLAIIQQIYDGTPITKAMAQKLNPDLTTEDFEELRQDLDEIGYKHTL
jgi:hypothetical protein